MATAPWDTRGAYMTEHLSSLYNLADRLTGAGVVSVRPEVTLHASQSSTGAECLVQMVIFTVGPP